jgi:hypothetical protein
MHTGMLWFDNNPKTDLSSKLFSSDIITRKIRQEANLCFVHPSADENAQSPLGILVKPNRLVLPNHLWIGMNESNQESENGQDVP